MNDKSLEKVITPKNRRLLLHLEESPKSSDRLCVLSEMDVMEFLSSVELLEKNNLVTKEKGVYRLTVEGELFVQKLFPTLLMEKFQGDTDGYLQNRNLDFVPLYLLERLHNIESYTVIQPNYVDMFDHNKEAHEAFKSSKTFKMIATSVRPHLFELLNDMADNEVDLSIIFDPRLLAKLQKDSPDELQELFNNRQVKIY